MLQYDWKPSASQGTAASTIILHIRILLNYIMERNTQDFYLQARLLTFVFQILPHESESLPVVLLQHSQWWGSAASSKGCGYEENQILQGGYSLEELQTTKKEFNFFS